MEPMFIWLTLASILVVVELMTGTFYLLMLGIGAVAALLLALAGAGIEIQGIGALIVGIIGCALLRRRQRTLRMSARILGQDRNINLDIGGMVNVPEWAPVQPAVAPPVVYHSRVRYRGTEWDVQTEAALAIAPEPGAYRIVAIHGSRLILAVGEPSRTS